MNTRNEAIDALRGFAIFTMILSGSIAFGGVLPAWMYHAQVPPPQHIFNPQIPGITWVDLVFPFFLFSMGAAIPLALHHKIEQGISFIILLRIAFQRFVLLAFFALFTQHMKAWVIAEVPTSKEHFLSLLAFVLLFFQLYHNQNLKYKLLFNIIKLLSFVIALLLLIYLPFWKGKGFDFYKSDIILMVLANMAFFGILIYYFTYNNLALRVGVLPFIMAIFLASKEPSLGFVKTIFNFNELANYKFDWLYKFYFLKYLFIIIPGTIAGDFLIKAKTSYSSNSKNASFISLALILVVCFNVYALFARHLTINLLFTCFAAYLLIKYFANDAYSSLHANFLKVGFYLLLLGLFFEAYEGGIKKDSSTYSYYFVTSGLAFLVLVIFDSFVKLPYLKALINWLASIGKNPMVAYVLGSLVLMPLLSLTHIKQYWDALNTNAVVGFFKGFVFTVFVSLITVFFVNKKWFWKT